jgi:hypothetical protein
MTAVIYRPDPLIIVPHALVAPATLAIAIAAVAVFIIALGLVGSLLDNHLERLALDEAERRRYIYELEETKLQLIAAKNLADTGSRGKSNFLANMSHELRAPFECNHWLLGFDDTDHIWAARREVSGIRQAPVARRSGAIIIPRRS